MGRGMKLKPKTYPTLYDSHQRDTLQIYKYDKGLWGPCCFYRPKSVLERNFLNVSSMGRILAKLNLYSSENLH